MKKISTYNFKGNINFNEEFITSNSGNTLTKEQVTLVNFEPLFDETYVAQVGIFKVAKIRYTSRKEPDKVVLSDLVFKHLDDNNLPQDVDTVEHVMEEKRLELMQYTGYTSKVALVVIDNTTGKFIITEDRKFSDNVMSLLLESFCGDYDELSLLSTEPVLTEKVLTNFLVDECKHLPDPFTLVEKVELGDKSILDKKPKTATVKIDKLYPADEEVLSFVSIGKVVKKLQLEYDGVLQVLVDNTLFIDKVAFQEDLKFKPDEDASDSVNFMNCLLPQLPVVFGAINLLESTVKEENY